MGQLGHTCEGLGTPRVSEKEDGILRECSSENSVYYGRWFKEIHRVENNFESIAVMLRTIREKGGESCCFCLSYFGCLDLEYLHSPIIGVRESIAT